MHAVADTVLRHRGMVVVLAALAALGAPYDAWFGPAD